MLRTPKALPPPLPGAHQTSLNSDPLPSLHVPPTSSRGQWSHHRFLLSMESARGSAVQVGLASLGGCDLGAGLGGGSKGGV